MEAFFMSTSLENEMKICFFNPQYLSQVFQNILRVNFLEKHGSSHLSHKLLKAREYDILFLKNKLNS